MSFFQSLSEFFESIFKANSPEVKKRQELRKIEAELKSNVNQIFKNEYLLPNFAELFRILYENSKPIEEILSSTISSSNVHQNGRFEYQLILTGFNDETQDKFEKLDYENRKQSIEESNDPSKTFELQRHTFETLLKQLNSTEFRKIDDTMAKVQQLADICKYNYMNVIHAFDSNFDGISINSLGICRNVAPEMVSEYLQDLYYLTANLSINTSVLRAVIALKQLKTGNPLSEKEKTLLSENVKKISMILTKMLTPKILQKIIQLGKKDPTYVPKAASYTTNSIKRFLEFVEGRFNADESRIKTEIKDYTISFSLKELFGESPLLQLKAYNTETNTLLRNNTPFALAYITPLQTMKTFLNMYYSDSVKAVLNNIELEGLFNDPNYKSSFSTAVSACNEVQNRFNEFEKTFDKGNKNDEAMIRSLIEDSKRDSDFLKKLGAFINSVNEQAHEFLQNESKIIFSLYKQITELLSDAKKSKPILIQNIKVLIASTRNRDGSRILEQQHTSWKIFLQVMKNYVVLGELEDDSQ